MKGIGINMKDENIKSENINKENINKENINGNSKENDYKEFVGKIDRVLTEYYQDEAEVKIIEAKKNNGIVLTGVCVMRKGKNIAPTIYLESFFEEYNKGMTLAKVVDRIIDITEEHTMMDEIDIEFFTDYERVKDYILFRLINTEKNEKMLREVPHINYLDMSIIFYCQIDMSAYRLDAGTSDEAGCIVIYDNHLKMWGKTKEELYEVAMINTPRLMEYDWIKMDELLLEILKNNMKNGKLKGDGMTEYELDIAAKETLRIMLDSMDVPMYVLSNKARRYGASVLLYKDVLKSFSIKSQHNFYIIPSSIHELIIVPDQGTESVEDLKNMVYQVNRTELSYEDILSDSVYKYDLERDEVIIM